MMKNFSTAQMLWLKSVLSFSLVIFVTGCGSYFNFMTKKQKLSKAFSKEQSADLLMQLAPEDAYLFLGELHFNRLPNGPLLLVAVTDKFSEREISALSPMQTPLGYYQIHLHEGTYELYSFVDVDGNGYFESHEMVGKMSLPITIADERVHLAAYKSYGFNASHVGILNNEKARETFYGVLSDLDKN